MRILTLLLPLLALSGCGVAGLATLVEDIIDEIEDDDPQVVVAADGIVAIDLDTGDRTVLADDQIGGGPDLVDPRAMAVVGDRAYVWDEDPQWIVEVGLDNGNRNVVASGALGAGTDLTSVRGIAYDADRARLLVLDVAAGGATLFAIDLGSGDRTEITGSGPILLLPRSIVVDVDEAYIGDAGLGGVVVVDLVSGDRSDVTNSTLGQGPMFVSPDALARGPTGLLYVLDTSLDILFGVDVQDGDRTVVASSSVGSGASLTTPTTVGYDTTAARAVVTQAFPQSMLLGIDPGTGDRDALAHTTLGVGPVLFFPAGVYVDTVRNRAIILNRAGN